MALMEQKEEVKHYTVLANEYTYEEKAMLREHMGNRLYLRELVFELHRIMDFPLEKNMELNDYIRKFIKGKTGFTTPCMSVECVNGKYYECCHYYDRDIDLVKAAVKAFFDGTPVTASITGLLNSPCYTALTKKVTSDEEYNISMTMDTRLDLQEFVWSLYPERGMSHVMELELNVYIKNFMKEKTGFTAPCSFVECMEGKYYECCYYHQSDSFFMKTAVQEFLDKWDKKNKV
jgi:hypothetical protein